MHKVKGIILHDVIWWHFILIVNDFVDTYTFLSVLSIILLFKLYDKIIFFLSKYYYIVSSSVKSILQKSWGYYEKVEFSLPDEPLQSGISSPIGMNFLRQSEGISRSWRVRSILLIYCTVQYNAVKNNPFL